MAQKTNLLSQLRKTIAVHLKASNELDAKADNLTSYGLRWGDLGKEERKHLEHAIREQDVAMEALAQRWLRSVEELFSLLEMDVNKQSHWMIIFASLAEIIDGKGGASKKWSTKQYYELWNDIEVILASSKGKLSDMSIARELKRKDGKRFSLSEDRLRKLVALTGDPKNNPGLLEPTLRLGLITPVFREFGICYSHDLLDLPEATNKKEAALAEKCEEEYLREYKILHEKEGLIWTKRCAAAYKNEVRKMARHVAKFKFNKGALLRAYARVGKRSSNRDRRKGE